VERLARDGIGASVLDETAIERAFHAGCRAILAARGNAAASGSPAHRGLL